LATTPSAPSLRFQIIASLGTLLVLAFLPLFFAVASLSRATALGVVNDEMAQRARTMAVAFDDARNADALPAALVNQARSASVLGIAVTDRETHALLAATSELPPEWNEARLTRGDASAPAARGALTDFAEDSGHTRVHVRFRPSDVEARVTPLLRLIALYIFLFGVVLLAFAYLALTRLIVRPIDQLSREAERVVGGARTFRPPSRGPREISELGVSVRTMTDTLVASEKSLRRKVDELTQATKRLTETQAQLVSSERLAGVGKLAAGVAHEIGNPIAAILGMLDLVKDPDISEEDRRDLLSRTQRETERISGIVKDLLDFARPEKSADSSTSLQMAVSTVDRAVKDVLSLVTAQKTWKQIKVETELLPALMVTLPEARLQQVLLNLLLNASHALGDRKEPVIRIRAKKESGRAVITVEDNGPGVPVAARAQIFEPFFTTKDVGEGTGLGLSVCRGLVEAIGGEITLDSTYTEGARFRITLPTADA
jgi:C4-dicarboxylate-specific signal transduction histidine kinase